MALEDLTGTNKYVSSLNPAWPVDGDWVDEGDNHIRGIKNVLKNTFPGWDGSQALFPNGTVALPGIGWINSVGSGFSHGGGGKLTYSMGGVQAFSVDAGIFGMSRVIKATTTGAYVFEDWKHEITSGVVGGAVLGIAHTSATAVGVEISYPNLGVRGVGNYYLVCKDSVGAVVYFMSNGGIGNYSANNVNACDAVGKTGIREAPDYTGFVGSLSYKRFGYVENPGGGETDDVIAQELEAIAPELVSEFGGDGKKAVLWYRLQARINSVIPRLIDRIEALEAKVAGVGGAGS